MMGYHRGDLSPIVHPALVELLATRLRDLDCIDIALVEARNHYDAFFSNRTVAEVADYFGHRSDRYRVVDASEDYVAHDYSRGMVQRSISRAWLEADLRISFGKLRSHPTDGVFGAIAPLEGLGGRLDEYLFVDRQADRETAVMMVLADFPPELALVDAWEQVPDGLVGAMGCRRPRSPLRFYGGWDALAVDQVVARHAGVEGQCRHVELATQWFGDPGDRVEVRGTDDPLSPWRSPYGTELYALLSFLANPVYLLFSGRGAMFLPEMDTASFPPSADRPGFLLRVARRMMLRLLGMPGPGAFDELPAPRP